MSYRSLRIGGLASGIDVESIIKQLMSAQKAKKDKLQQQKTLLEWKREDYRTINNQIRKLRDATADLRLQGTFLKNKATSSDESKVSVTADGSAVGTYEITVERLATSSRLVGTTNEKDGQPLDLSKPISELFDDIDPDGDGQITLTINGETMAFGKSDSLAAVFYAVNRNEKAGVVMFYDETEKRVVVTTKATGSESRQILHDMISDTGTDNALLKALGLVPDNPSEAIEEGQNAVFTINGLKTERSSNTFSINGVTFTLKDTTSAPVTVGVERDTDAIVEKIKSWVDTYNSTLEAINAELNEQRYRDYLPLTEEEMAELTDKQIDKWEEKARSGLLKHDSLLRGELYNIRMAVFGMVQGLDEAFNHLSDIGITVATATFDSNGKLLMDDDYMSGKLHVNEDELRNALETNPEKVMALFTNRSDDPEQQGIGARLYALAGEAIERIADMAGRDSDLVDNSSIGERIRDLNERIEREEDRLQRLEDRYWKQFTEMEKAINQMNQQSSWLLAQFLGTGNQ